MNKTLQTCLSILALTVAITVGALGFCTYRIESEFVGIGVKANQTFDTINRDCGGGHSCGTLADVAKTLNTVRGTFGQIEVAANHEDKNLATLDRQELTLFADMHSTAVQAQSTLAGVNQTAQAASTALQTANGSIAAAQPLLEAATRTTTDLDKAVNNPAIHQTAAHVESITASGDKIAADAAFEADKLTHPTKVKLTFWVIVQSIIKYIHSIEPPIF